MHEAGGHAKSGTLYDRIKRKFGKSIPRSVCDLFVQCFKKLVRVEGVRSLYYSFPTTLFMNLPYGGVMVATNETLKSYFNPSGGQNVPAFFTRFVLMNARSLL